ncbi:hypothetical protein [Streptomyces sp. NPDC059491]
MPTMIHLTDNHGSIDRGTALLRAERSDVVAVIRTLPELAATLMRWRRRR